MVNCSSLEVAANDIHCCTSLAYVGLVLRVG